MRNRGIFRPVCLMAVMACIFLIGCTRVQVPVLKEVNVASFRMKGLTTAELELVLEVDNPNDRPVSVEGLTGSLRYESGSPFAGFELLNPPVSASAASVSSLNATLLVTLTDPLSLLTSGMDIRNLDMNAFLIDVNALAAFGGVKRKYRLNGYPAGNLASYLKR